MLQVGDRIRFRRDGKERIDTIVRFATQTIPTVPLAPRVDINVALLKKHSWCRITDIIEGLPRKGTV